MIELARLSRDVVSVAGGWRMLAIGLVVVLAAVSPAHADFRLSDQEADLYYQLLAAAGEELIVEGGVAATGDLHSNGRLHVKKDALVTGDVTVVGELLLQGTVDGQVTEAAEPRDLPRLLSEEELRALADRVFEGDTTFTDEVIDDVVLVIGTARFRGDLNGVGTVLATGEIRLDTTGRHAGNNGAPFTLGDETRLSLVALGNVRIGPSRPFRGIVRSGGDVMLEEGVAFEGVLVAERQLHVKKDSTLTFVDFDLVAPVVELLSPASDSFVTVATPPVSVRYSDEFSGLRLETLELSVDGTDVTADAVLDGESPEATLAWTPPGPLAEGAHMVEAAATDHSDNEGRESFSFVVDTVAPVVTVTSPADGAVVPDPGLTVEGTVTDAGSGVASVTVNGQPAAVAGSGFSASLTLVPGPNVIVVQATDAVGHSSSVTLTVTLGGDTEPPTLRITAPLAGVFITEARPPIDVSFRDDDSGVDPESLAFTANGAPLPVSCNLGALGARCTPTADLADGAVSLGAQIRDQAGNLATAAVELIVDTEGLQVLVTSPETGLVTRDGEVTVTGSVSVDVAKVEVNGVPATLSGRGFSAVVPLREGVNMVVALATKPNGRTGTGSVEVTRDLVAPIVRIDAPADGSVSISRTVPVVGLVNDMIDAGLTPIVHVNGMAATVAAGSFVIEELELVPGPNRIEAVATDGVGNESRHAITVTFRPPVGVRIGFGAGNGQLGFVGQPLAQPLVAVVTDDLGNPVAGRLVRFDVTRNSGTLRQKAADPPQRVLQVPTDGAGRASVLFTLGDTAGEGNNRVRAAAVGVAGEVEFCASALPAAPDRILMVMGDNQRGVVGHPLALPLEALVVDADGNPVPGLPVTFEVARGTGTIDGQGSVVRVTNANGSARVAFTVGHDPGINNNVVRATYDGLTGLPATFTASGLAAGDAAETRFTGVVLDNGHTPIPGAVAMIDGFAGEAVTDDQGRFELTGVPVGHVHLVIDPSGSPRPEVFPPLAFETVTVAGQENTLGQPILIPALDDTAQIVGGDEDVTLTMEGVDGLSLTVFAHSATFPNGSRVGPVSISQVHLDKVPMAPPLGTVFIPPAWTIQPAGVHFDPPARVTLPNNGLPPGRIVDIFQFDHAVNQFVNVGKGEVTQDGFRIESLPGFGITRAGWGGGGAPPPPDTCVDGCDDSNMCTTDACVDGSCQFEPVGDGAGCEDDGDMCTEDVCMGGACVHEPIECEECQRCREGTCEPDPDANGDACEDEGDPSCSIDRCENGTCEHTPVDEVTPHDPDPLGLDVDGLGDAASDGLDCLRDAVTAAGGGMRVNSAFRPQAYQTHLREVWDKHELLEGWNEAECAAVIANVNEEWARHGLRARPARTSNHSGGNAFDATVTLPAGQDVDDLADGCGLHRPHPGADPVHFEPR